MQSRVEIGVDKNTTVVFPAPLMSTIAELSAVFAREGAAAKVTPSATADPVINVNTTHQRTVANGTGRS